MALFVSVHWFSKYAYVWVCVFTFFYHTNFTLVAVSLSDSTAICRKSPNKIDLITVES